MVRIYTAYTLIRFWPTLKMGSINAEQAGAQP